MTASGTAGRRWPVPWDFAALAVIVLLGLVVMTMPYFGDQALFSIGGRALRGGAVMYRDFWDLKQPGIFVFYGVGGAVSGDRAWGPHLLELLWLLGLAVALQVALTSRLRSRTIAAFAPLLVVGVQYAVIRVDELTQVEALVGLPLLLALWASAAADDDGRSARSRAALLAGAGIATGVVAWLKLPYVAIPVLWLLMVAWRRARRGGARTALAALGAWAVGLAMPVAVFLVYFGLHGQLGEVARTYFVYTPGTTARAGRPVSRLVDGVVHFAVVWALPLVLALAGLVLDRLRDRDLLRRGLLVWTLAAVPLVLVQHWWAYLWLVVAVPVGTLGAFGLDELWVRRASVTRGARVAVAVVIVALALVPAAAVAVHTRTLVRNDLGLTQSGRDAIALHYEAQYGPARELARALERPPARPGALYVLGNPIDDVVTGRGQGIAVNGWAAEQYDARLWRRIERELRADPPPYLVINRFSAGYVARRAPSLGRWVARRYCAFGGGDSATWYARRPSPQCRPGS